MSGVDTMDAEKAAAQDSKAATPDPKLVALRAEMKASGIQAFLVPSQDRAAVDGRCCPPRHPTPFEPPYLECSRTLRRGERYPYCQVHVLPRHPHAG
jgi:hypothetical protein